MTVHEAFVERWVAGWARSRSLSVERDGAGWCVLVGSETRHEEYVVAEPSPAEALRLARLVERRYTSWLTVIGGIGPEALAAFASLDRVARVETVMEARLAAVPMPSDVLVAVADSGDVAHLVVEIDGQVAARGQVAVLGRDAVFDRIETEAAFRRRGLGRTIVAGLTSWAAARGADTGLLLASEQGRALYRAAGWRDVAPAVTFRGFL
ncbi:GNAT family N-acetyltransferase [Curtobacterium sp. 9128]|uniref:GNAT family N-acetyltransferase n=1 Tax=Curtobacterium sp. 9128 TaxID=1793722 RepID=UPI00119F0C42|nr:GNAT family N-acetyltransferase [Curtobacterium sp. 9128]